MAAGLGFKDFQTGEVLTAADVDGYLMQGIWVFDDATARDAAVTSPQEGNACYLKDTNQVLTYSGSTWVAVAGSSPLTTKGDLFGFSTVNARIPIGANNTVLTADSGETLGLKWATPAAGGMTLLSTTTLSGTSTTISGINQTYTNLLVIINDPYVNTGDPLRIDPNSTNSISNWSGVYTQTPYTDNTMYSVHNLPTSSTAENSIAVLINQYANTSYAKPFSYSGNFNGTGSPVRTVNYGGAIATTSAISSIKFTTVAGTSTFSDGQVLIYGVK
jgi:hypothetical protein